LIERHLSYTGSTLAKRILSQWAEYVKRFVKVMPTEYRKVLAQQHLDSDAAKLASV
jgi:glutamate synthase domain-containing protein 3